MASTPIIDYGMPSTERSIRRKCLRLVGWFRRNWLRLVVVVGTWLLISYWQAREQAVEHAALLGTLPVLWFDSSTKTWRVEICSSFANFRVPRYEAKIIRAKIGKITWTPTVSDTLWGVPMHVGPGANEAAGSSVDIPAANLPYNVATSGGTIQMTLTLDVVAHDCLLQFPAPVTVTVDRTVTITFPPSTLTTTGFVPIPAASLAN